MRMKTLGLKVPARQGQGAQEDCGPRGLRARRTSGVSRHLSMLKRTAMTTLGMFRTLDVGALGSKDVDVDP